MDENKKDSPEAATKIDPKIQRQRIRQELDAKIPRDVVKQRDGGGGRSLSYLEGHYVINRLNEVLGQGNWEYDTEEMRLVYEGKITNNYGKQIFTCHYVSKVRLAVFGLNDEDVRYGRSFSDYGYGDGTDKSNPGKAHELAVKEAVTDAIKRCAKNLGMSMGLALYSKDQENVTDEPVETNVDGVRNEPETQNAGKSTFNVPKQGNPDTKTSSKPSVAGSATREILLKSITAHARAAVAKKVTSMDGLREYMKSNFGVEAKEQLKDDQAAKFLEHLKGVLN